MTMMLLRPETLTLSSRLQGTNSEWWMALGSGTARGPGDYPKVTVARDDTGDLTFTIINPAGTMFASTNPFGPKVGAPNPTDFWDQFTVVSGAGTKRLVVHDANANKDGSPYAGGDYNYQLNFSSGTPSLDPVITNGGCCNKPFAGNNLAFLAIGLVALVVIYVLIVRPMMSRRGPTDIDQV